MEATPDIFPPLIEFIAEDRPVNIEFTATPTRMIRRAKFSFPGKGIHQEKSQDSSQKGKEGSEKKQGGRRCSNDHCRKAGPAGNTDDPRICQRIFQHCLKKHAGDSHCRSCQHRDHDPGKSQVENGRYRLVRFQEDSSEKLGKSHFQASDIHRRKKQDHQKQNHDPERQSRPGGLSLSSVFILFLCGRDIAGGCLYFFIVFQNIPSLLCRFLKRLFIGLLRSF